MGVYVKSSHESGEYFGRINRMFTMSRVSTLVVFTISRESELWSTIVGYIVSSEAVSHSVETIKMSNKFEVSEKRYVVVKKTAIRIFEDGTRKAATFTYPRWAQFVENVEEIDNAVSKLVKVTRKVVCLQVC